MKEVFVNSSVIARMAYSHEKKRLLVMFKGGSEAVWEYQGFPPIQFEFLVESGSKGSFFMSNVRGKYAEEKVGKGAAAFDARWRDHWCENETSWEEFEKTLERIRADSGRAARINF